MSEHRERTSRALAYLAIRPRQTLWQFLLPWLLAGLAIGAVIALSGCAHKAEHFTIPDAKPLQAKQAEVARHASHAVRAVTAAAEAHGRAVAFHRAEGTIIEEAAAILAQPAFQNAPTELKPEIDALAAKLAEFTAAHALTTASMGEVTPLLAEGRREAASAVSGADEITAKLGPAYVAKVATITAEANKAQEAWAKDSAKIVKLETASWVNRILALAGACALAGLAFLWWTGRAAKLAATVAAKL